MNALAVYFEQLAKSLRKCNCAPCPTCGGYHHSLERGDHMKVEGHPEAMVSESPNESSINPI